MHDSCPNCGGQNSLTSHKTRGQEWLGCNNCYATFLITSAGKLSRVLNGLADPYPTLKSSATPPLSIDDWEMVGRTRKKRVRKKVGVKLTEEDVRAIRGRLKKGEDLAGLAREFAVSRGTIRDIKYGMTWKGVGE